MRRSNALAIFIGLFMYLLTGGAMAAGAYVLIGDLEIGAEEEEEAERPRKKRKKRKKKAADESDESEESVETPTEELPSEAPGESAAPEPEVDEIPAVEPTPTPVHKPRRARKPLNAPPAEKPAAEKPASEPAPTPKSTHRTTLD